MPARSPAFAAVISGWSCGTNEASAGSALRSVLRFPRSLCASANRAPDVAVWSEARVSARSERTAES